jgi:hypothetical protein
MIVITATIMLGFFIFFFSTNYRMQRETMLNEIQKKCNAPNGCDDCKKIIEIYQGRLDKVIDLYREGYLDYYEFYKYILDIYSDVVEPRLKADCE